MSELGESGRPYGELVRAWFFIVSLVLAGFGIGVARLVPRSRTSLAGQVLYLSWAGLGVASVLFPCDPGCAGETFSGWMHRLIGEIMTVLILPVPTLIWLGVRHHPHWRGFGWIALPAQALLVAASLALGAAVYTRVEVGGVALRDAAGLFQWLWWLVLYGWNFALGIWLLRTDRLGGFYESSLLRKRWKAIRRAGPIFYPSVGPKPLPIGVVSKRCRLPHLWTSQKPKPPSSSPAPTQATVNCFPLSWKVWLDFSASRFLGRSGG